MPSILFVCTANRFRSPLAAAMLRQHLAALGLTGDWRISSAGTWAVPGQPVVPEISEAARHLGLDLSDHHSMRLSRELLNDHDLILVMQAGQREALVSEFPNLQDRVYLLSHVVERRAYDIPDALGSEQDTAEVVAELDSLIRRGLEYICVLATSLDNARRRSKDAHG